MLNCTEGKRPSETQNARSSTAGRFEENNMKKFVTAIILVCMMLSMAACGGSWICESPLIEAGDWEEIGRRTREALKALKADAL